MEFHDGNEIIIFGYYKRNKNKLWFNYFTDVKAHFKVISSVDELVMEFHDDIDTIFFERCMVGKKYLPCF